MEENSLAVEPVDDGTLMMASLYSWLSKRERWEEKFKQALAKNPFEATMVMLLGGSVLFFQAEYGVNPKVKTFWDALYFISTCASVGYADIFASTKTGKAVSSFVMTFGPTLTANVLEKRAVEPPPSANELQLQPILERLDAILEELRRLRPRISTGDSPQTGVDT